MDTKSWSPALWYPHLTCRCVAAATADSGVFADAANSFPHCPCFCALAKFLLWTSTKIYSHWQCTKTIQSTIHKMCQIQPLNCSTPAQIKPFRCCILLSVMIWHLLLSFSNRELKNKISLSQAFQERACFCWRLILSKCSYPLNTSNCWTLLEAHLPFLKLLYCQAGLESFQE